MSNKTVTQEGKIYQLNSIYVLDDGSKVVLDGVINGESLKVSRLDCEKDWFAASELFLCDGVVIGTIEDAPIELESGHCYYCEINQNTEKLEYATMFFHEGEWYWDSELSDVCRDFALRYIKPLYKMVRAN